MEKIAEHLSSAIVNSVNEKLAMIKLHGGGLSAGNPLANFLRRNVKNPINNAMFDLGLKDPLGSLANFKQRNIALTPRINDVHPGRGPINPILQEIIRDIRR